MCDSGVFVCVCVCVYVCVCVSWRTDCLTDALVVFVSRCFQVGDIFVAEDGDDLEAEAKTGRSHLLSLT